MNLQTLLGDVPAAAFVAEYVHRQPFSRPGGAKGVCELGTWEVLGAILAGRGVGLATCSTKGASDPARADEEVRNTSPPDVMVVRDGERVADRDPASEAEARALADDGCTILVRHAERHHAGLEELANGFARDFCADVNIHIYATPPGAHGFSWHYDAEDVFILQTAGAKEYSLRKNTVHPWPLEETIPADMRYPAEIMPLLRVLLQAGDWLYIPCGWWHKAQAADAKETAISLAIGVMSPAAISIYDALRPKLLESLLWRQRLPVAGEAADLSEDELRDAYREILAQLADDLGKMLRDDRMASELFT